MLTWACSWCGEGSPLDRSLARGGGRLLGGWLAVTLVFYGVLAVLELVVVAAEEGEVGFLSLHLEGVPERGPWTIRSNPR